MKALRILWLKTGPLHPLDTGGKIRTYNMLRMLKKTHHVTYLSLCPPEVEEKNKNASREYSHEQSWVAWRETPKRSAPFFAELGLNFFSALPYVIAKYKSPEMARRIAEFDAQQKFDLIICDFLTPAINVLNAAERLKTPTLLFQHNVEALIWKRLFERAGNVVKKAYFREQWRRLQEYERKTSARFDGVVGVSEEDCQIMRSEYGLANVLGAVPAGVESSFFERGENKVKEKNIVFLGSMDWMPNIDAVNYFVGEIFPVIKQRCPEVVFTIVGRNPPVAIRELTQHDPSIHVTGTVEDVRPFLAEATAMVVPLRIGGGTRIKIYEGMAAGIPVVSTPIGAEGLPLTHGEHILLADSPAKFAQETINLLNDEGLRGRIGQSGRTLVRDRFSWESATTIFEEYCLKVSSGRKERN